MSVTVHSLLEQTRAGATFVAGDFPVDEAIVDKFPLGTVILSATRYGTSAWTVTARLVVQLPDGSEERYFLNCASDDIGRTMMEGEFSSMSELYKTMPSFIPKPHSWGKYRVENPDTYFFISQFIDMSNRVPEPNQFCAKLAQLHRSSVSPTGKFGFHITTCQGRIPQRTGQWESKWTDLFTKLLEHVVELDFQANGHWEALDRLEKRIFSSVIPRLIGKLERDGRSIRPCLIHADLWEGNTGTAYDTGDIYIFDAGAYYAHSEIEIGD